MAKKTEVRASTSHINPFGLRMQPDLRERLEAAATAAGRSLNAEITERLEASFRPDSGGILPSDYAQRLMLNLSLAHHAQDVLERLRKKHKLSVEDEVELRSHERLKEDLEDEILEISRRLAKQRQR